MDGAEGQTAAELRKARLQRDREQEIQALRRGLATAPELANRLRPDQEGYDDFVAAGGIANGLWPTVRAALPPEAVQRCDLDRLVFHDLDQDDVSAVCTVEADGSALVLLADGLLGAITFTAHQLAYCSGLGGSFPKSRLTRASLQTSRGRVTERQATTGALTRYWLLQQRCFGISGKLNTQLNATEEDLSTLLMQLASIFVLAHEVAHFVFGHPPSSAFDSVRNVSMPVVSDSEDLELEADQFALDCLRRYLPDGPKEFHALTGAAVALIAIDVVEQGLFARRSRTHPTFEGRWRQLLHVSSPKAAAEAGAFVAIVKAPMLSAARAKSHLTEQAWSRVWADDSVIKTSHNFDAMRYTPVLDRIVHSPPPDGALWRLALGDPALARIAELAEQLAPGLVRHALERLGVHPRDIDTLGDSRIAVSHWSVLTMLMRSKEISRLDSTTMQTVVGLYLSRQLLPLLGDASAWAELS